MCVGLLPITQRKTIIIKREKNREQWIKLELLILVVPDLNFCQVAGYPDSDFPWFS
jgi:hypothetical protein